MSWPVTRLLAEAAPMDACRCSISQRLSEDALFTGKASSVIADKHRKQSHEKGRQQSSERGRKHLLDCSALTGSFLSSKIGGHNGHVSYLLDCSGETVSRPLKKWVTSPNNMAAASRHAQKV